MIVLALPAFAQADSVQISLVPQPPAPCACNDNGGYEATVSGSASEQLGQPSEELDVGVLAGGGSCPATLAEDQSEAQAQAPNEPQDFDFFPVSAQAAGSYSQQFFWGDNGVAPGTYRVCAYLQGGGALPSDPPVASATAYMTMPVASSGGGGSPSGGGGSPSGGGGAPSGGGGAPSGGGGAPSGNAGRLYSGRNAQGYPVYLTVKGHFATLSISNRARCTNHAIVGGSTQFTKLRIDAHGRFSRHLLRRHVRVINSSEQAVIEDWLTGLIRGRSASGHFRVVSKYYTAQGVHISTCASGTITWSAHAA